MASHNYGKDFFRKEPRLRRGTSVYLQNPKGEFLLQLRTADASREPGKWTAISGALGHQESPEETIVREVKEELGAHLGEFTFFKDYLWISDEGQHIWYNHNFVFYAKINLLMGKIHLAEGQKVQYFSAGDILKMDLAFNHAQTFRELIDWLDLRKNGY